MTVTTPSALSERLVRYASGLKQAGAIRTEAVERAFATVPRHRCLHHFRYRTDEYVLGSDSVPTDVLDLIYANNSLVTHTGRDGDPPSSSSAPSLMARMLEALDLRPGHRVLEIGAGTGYNAALIAHITGAEVVAIEAGAVAAAGATASIRALGLTERVHIIHGDGYTGHTAQAPYDRIIVTCGIAGVSPRWLDQLATDGVVLAPIAHAGMHPVVAVRRLDDGGLTGRVMMWADFMPAAGHLRPVALIHHDPAVDLPADRLRPAGGTGTSLTAVEYSDLWFCLGTQDTRVTRAYLADGTFDPGRGACALVDPIDGAAWIHRDGGITLAGALHLHGDLVTLVNRWEHLGRPASTAWSTRFRHADTDADGLHLPDQWDLSTR